MPRKSNASKPQKAAAAAERPARSVFNRALCQRTRRMRESMKHPNGKPWTIVQMAEVMGVGEEAWRSYEVRIPIPHYLIPRFARVCGQTIEFVITGKDPIPVRVVSAQAAE